MIVVMPDSYILEGRLIAQHDAKLTRKALETCSQYSEPWSSKDASLTFIGHTDESKATVGRQTAIEMATKMAAEYDNNKASLKEVFLVACESGIDITTEGIIYGSTTTVSFAQQLADALYNAGFSNVEVYSARPPQKADAVRVNITREGRAAGAVEAVAYMNKETTAYEDSQRTNQPQRLKPNTHHKVTIMTAQKSHQESFKAVFQPYLSQETNDVKITSDNSTKLTFLEIKKTQLTESMEAAKRALDAKNTQVNKSWYLPFFIKYKLVDDPRIELNKNLAKCEESMGIFKVLRANKTGFMTTEMLLAKHDELLKKWDKDMKTTEVDEIETAIATSKKTVFGFLASLLPGANDKLEQAKADLDVATILYQTAQQEYIELETKRSNSPKGMLAAFTSTICDGGKVLRSLLTDKPAGNARNKHLEPAYHVQPNQLASQPNTAAPPGSKPRTAVTQHHNEKKKDLQPNSNSSHSSRLGR